jgi:hypothetical protein
MTLRILLQVVLLGGALPASSQDQIPVDLACKVPQGKFKVPQLQFEGTAPFPDKAILKLTLQRTREQYLGGQLRTVPEEVGAGLVQIKSHKFSLQRIWELPGGCVASLDLQDHLQTPTVLPLLQGKLAVRQWRFEFPGWGDELVPQLGPALEEIGVLAQETRDLVKKVEAACVSEETWLADKERLLGEVNQLRHKLQSSGVARLYPASLSQLHYTVSDIFRGSFSFVWNDGRFAVGASYANRGQPATTSRQEVFNFENLLRYVEEAPALAGREFALWILKDLRRGGPRDAIIEVLRNQAEHPGVSVFAERLERATAGDLEALEKEIRGEPPGDTGGEKKP